MTINVAAFNKFKFRVKFAASYMYTGWHSVALSVVITVGRVNKGDG